MQPLRGGYSEGRETQSVAPGSASGGLASLASIESLIGERVLLFENDLGEGEPVVCHISGGNSQVLRVESDDQRFLSLDGRSCYARMWDSGGFVQLPVRVAMRVQAPPVFVAELEPLGEPEVVQRRSFLRLNVNLDVVVRLLGEDSTGDSSGDEQFCTTVDFSAGGVRLAGLQGVNEGDLLEMKISLSDTEAVSVKGKVLGFAGQGIVRVAFQEVGEGLSARLCRFVFDTTMAARRASLRQPIW